MATALWEKIEAIRRAPEHVRQRYVVLCVSLSMVFIVGIWLLSVSESAFTAAGDLPQAVEQQKKNMTGGAPSLNDLFQQSAPLRIEDKTPDGSKFFNGERNKGDTNSSQ